MCVFEALIKILHSQLASRLNGILAHQKTRPPEVLGRVSMGPVLECQVHSAGVCSGFVSCILTFLRFKCNPSQVKGWGFGVRCRGVRESMDSCFPSRLCLCPKTKGNSLALIVHAQHKYDPSPPQTLNQAPLMVP